jgi:ribosomal-protein-alanine N-acetyltransferase
VTLRPASLGDVAVIAELEALLFGHDAWSPESVRGALEGPGRCLLVAVEGTHVLGYVVTAAAGDVVDLQRIGVRPSCRRQGWACVLLDAALAEARVVGADRMLLEVSAANAPARAFYAAAGFVQIDLRRRYYRDGSDAVVMSRGLDPLPFPDGGVGAAGTPGGRG